MVDLLLINPGAQRVIYQGLSDELTGLEPPLWCRLIAGYCRDRGWQVEILDAEAVGWDVGQVVRRVEVLEPRLAVVVAHGHQPSASTQQMTGALATLSEIRRNLPKQKTAICGGHVSALPERTRKDAPGTVVIAGEGPEEVNQILSGRIAPKPPLRPLSALEGAVWDLLPMDKYRAHNWQCFGGSSRSPYASIVTSLGCPHKCSFCCINAPFGGPSYRTRSPVSVVREVEYLYREFGVATFKIADEMFVLKPSHYLPICEGLAALPFAEALNIWAYARVDTIRPDELALMRRAGIRWLCLGIESGSEHVRDGAEKSIGEDDIHEAVRAIQQAGINVIGNFIFGLPDDTIESMTQTLTLALSLRCEFANFYSAMPYPGSALFDITPLSDMPDSWSGYSQHSADCKPLPTATLTSRQVLEFRDEAHVRYFTDPEYLGYVKQKFGAAALSQIENGLTTRLDRDLLVA